MTAGGQGRRRRRGRVGGGAALVAVVALLLAGTEPVAARPGAVAAGDAVEWPTAGYDLRNSRAVVDAAITEATVDSVTERWRAPLDGFGSLSTVPIVVGDTVYVAGGSGGVAAVDRTTGAIRWTSESSGFNIGPFGVAVDDTRVYALDGSHGVQGDLWGHPEVNSGGGAWYPPAVDEKRGLVYVGVANPAPFPGTPEYPNGTSRPGANLSTDSLVALDLETGALRWYHQVTAHDIFDRDQVHALIAEVRGKDVVVSAGKSGVLVGLDARTGRVRWSTAVPGDPLGGATVVGDLVFTALLDGTVLALDRKQGDIVRSWALPGGINGWMAALDDMLLVPVGQSRPPQLVALGLP